MRGRIVVIHHGDQSRLKSALGTARLVQSALRPWGSSEISEIARQPAQRPVSVLRLLGRQSRLWKLERERARYLGVSQRWVGSTGLLGVRALQLLSPQVRSGGVGIAHIELSLTAKHVLAWRNAFEDELDFLVVLEDDARVRDDSDARIRQLLSKAHELGSVSDFFLDLAGGLSDEELRDSHLERPLGNGISRLGQPTTNTACAYFLGGSVVADLASHSILRPQRAVLPADWLILEGFMSLPAARREEIICLRSSPRALVHGSFGGLVTSTIR